MPEIMDRELLHFLGLQPGSLGCPVEPPRGDIPVVERLPVSVVKTKSSSCENDDSSECLPVNNKEGVDGSSPSESLGIARISPCAPFPLNPLEHTRPLTKDVVRPRRTRKAR